MAGDDNDAEKEGGSGEEHGYGDGQDECNANAVL